MGIDRNQHNHILRLYGSTHMSMFSNQIFLALLSWRNWRDMYRPECRNLGTCSCQHTARCHHTGSPPDTNLHAKNDIFITEEVSSHVDVQCRCDCHYLQHSTLEEPGQIHVRAWPNFRQPCDCRVVYCWNSCWYHLFVSTKCKNLLWQNHTKTPRGHDSWLTSFKSTGLRLWWCFITSTSTNMANHFDRIHST